MKRFIPILSFALALTMLFSACSPSGSSNNNAAQVTEVTAKSMRLARIVPEVMLYDETGEQIQVQTDMRLFSGNEIQTGKEGKAGISLDDTKAATLGTDSDATLHQEGKALAMTLDKGEMYFSVSKPLDNDESFNISTSTMTMGIRGTSGYVAVVNDKECSVILTSGHATIVADGSTQEIAAGQCVYVKYTDQGVTFDLFDVSPEDYPLLLLQELGLDTAILDEVNAQNDGNTKDMVAAMNAYADIIANAESYDYGKPDTYTATGVYKYALEETDMAEGVPMLLLQQETEEYLYYVRLFQYDPATGSVIAPTDSIENGVAMLGGLVSRISMFDDGSGIMLITYYSTAGDRNIYRISIDGNSLKQELIRTDLFGDDLPNALSSHEITWKDLSKFGAQVRAPLPTDGDRQVFAGTVHYYSVDEVLALQGITDERAIENYRMMYEDQPIGVIVLDETVWIKGIRAGGNVNSPYDTVGIDNDMTQYDGEHHIFSIPASVSFTSDVRLPEGPHTGDFHILD